MFKRTLISSLVFGGGLIAGAVLTGRLESTDVGERSAPPVAAQTSTTALRTELPSFADVAAARTGSVTNISSLRMTRQSRSPFGDDPFFRYFFGDDQPLFGWRQRPSLGSGVIVSSDGYILTNNHVVGSLDAEVTVTLADQREWTASVIGVDQWTDIALLKIEAEALPTIPWGDSSALRVADWVLAIGNPFQLNQTVTLGIVSAVGRANVGVATYEDFIQTDAAINPGNSGGALVDDEGALVGINTAIYSQSGGYQGVGFAVPSNLARRVMQDLIEFGEVRRGSIGYIEIAPLTSQAARELGVPDTRGALVSRMRRDSVAYRAGLRPGDVVVAFDGVSVDDAAHFLRLLSDATIGSQVTLELIRDGRRLEVAVEVSQATRRR